MSVSSHFPFLLFHPSLLSQRAHFDHVGLGYGRTFTSPAVEELVLDYTGKMKDPDLAMLFENALTSTLGELFSPSLW